MAKGKRTYVGLYSEETGNLCYVTNIQKRNFGPGEKLTVNRYNKVTKKHEKMKMKEIKKG